ncbi:alanine--tRNA ligase [Geothermobacter hydrogeniphilus]|uniref:Alanine--tRNA ligase n=1 Tax=Geothermobacter hydrogeniphilus TaxID=1969733 RepID=A0A2K2H6S4_9BACT|nr:alanine--tRNA ligase [Geothermobacter hydrogeniphilus]PNU19014.1 alanine--tRNA ligase [Geothermobacter hydrogeniphilus]
MTGSQIRQKFLDYFAARGHTVVSSSSLVPHNDPTLLFTNAGMNQFKDCFLGAEKRSYVRAASSQKCVRAGGKHNDLENVGRTARHHTFFEMLGNFSFGDYFKPEAIAFAWEFLTGELQLDTDRLYVTVYTDDDEAADIWHKQEGVPKERIFRFGEKDNFWSMGDTGPCGPCSEIFWDNGPGTGCGSPDCAVGCDCDRYMEIWNNVFMQFDRQPDGTLVPLPKPAVDTGMGLERITTVMQGVTSNYDTDLLRDVIRNIEQLSGKRYGDREDDDVSMRVLADHSRATAYLIADGVLPSNEGRGYVLRRIMRRAMRHAKMLGFEDPILYRTAVFVLEFMAEAYPEEAERRDFVARVVQNEEHRFIQTLGNGLRILQDEVAKLKADGRSRIPGETVFKLYDTYGFPVDLTADIVEKDGFSLDEEGFESCMEQQRAKAREHWKGSGEEAISAVYKQLVDAGIRCRFSGYQTLEDQGDVLALVRGGERIDEAVCGETVDVITAVTPCYGESGGQVGDTGEICTANATLRILDTRKPLPDLHVHLCEVVTGAIRTGDRATLRVDAERRRQIVINHTATHLLQAAMQRILGDHVKQAGSLVEPERLRFDFTHFSPLSDDELRRIEIEVNRQIRANAAVQAEEMSADAAREAGAMALFGEKYGDVVRVISIDDYSKELCGGTHAEAAGDIGLFRIISEGGIAAGVRRIEAVTGQCALERVQQQQQVLNSAAGLIKSDPEQLPQRLEKLLEQQKELEREVSRLRSELQAGQAGDLLAKTVEIAGIKVLATAVESMNGKQLREMADKLRDKLGSGALVLGCEFNGKANLLVAVSKDLTDRLHAGQLVGKLAAGIGGRGGGRPDLAQAGGSEPDKLAATLEQTTTLIKEQLDG